MSLEFILTSLVVVLIPGTGVLYMLAIGLGQGGRGVLAAAIGCTLGIVPSAFASIVGLAAIFHTSALAFQTIKYLGVAYLFYMAWSMLRDRGIMAVEEERAETSATRIIIGGTLLNALNPKLSLFFLAFLPQFVPAAAENATTQFTLLAAVFMAMTFIVFIGYGASAAFARDRIVSRPSVMVWLKRSFAATFGLLGLRLALADR